VYAKDKRWTAELKAGTVTFDGTAGWHQALQEYADLYADGCFQPGVVGTPSTTAIAEFAQGQGLMLADTSTQKGGLDAAVPSFSYSFHPFPGGAAPGATATALNLNFSTAVSAPSSAANQAAAQAFVDFLARPEQENLYARIEGGLTQYEFLKQETPSFMSGYASVLANHEYVILPDQTWWNPSVSATLAQYDVGLLTGQSSIDQILNAMDTAWKLGPS
jgi:raffinose/stachyose/melibiose transport system substrate-binding protein